MGVENLSFSSSSPQTQRSTGRSLPTSVCGLDENVSCGALTCLILEYNVAKIELVAKERRPLRTRPSNSWTWTRALYAYVGRVSQKLRGQQKSSIYVPSSAVWTRKLCFHVEGLPFRSIGNQTRRIQWATVVYRGSDEGALVKSSLRRVKYSPPTAQQSCQGPSTSFYVVRTLTAKKRTATEQEE